MKRRFLLLGLLLLLLAPSITAWTLAGLPPPRYLLRYGLSPGCEPTGETVTLEGVEFVEIGPGIFRMGSTHLAKGGDLLGRICARLGLPWGGSLRLPSRSGRQPEKPPVEGSPGPYASPTPGTRSPRERGDVPAEVS